MPSSWWTPIDAYCERTEPSFWAEPLNAVSNAAFLMAAAYAFILWRRKGGRDWPALWLVAVTTVVGIGSFLFHTFANCWSLLADVLPIAVFIYSYFLLAMRRYLGLALLPAVGVTGFFILFNMGTEQVWSSLLPGFTLNGSVGYIPAVLALLAVGAACLVIKRSGAGRALLLAAGILTVSLVLRSIDAMVCPAWPWGTHVFWHLLNGLVLFLLMRTAILHAPPPASVPR
ncbi:ceramidase domain-containing protein [Microvirga terricola]|uniref:Ceramidase n=1 Tax=Microvirga terricola TaxID=2719797 RepID=A0ABX0VE58_9HYPH|nr:hypothetical protein [Microvirga terricola]